MTFTVYRVLFPARGFVKIVHSHLSNMLDQGSDNPGLLTVLLSGHSNRGGALVDRCPCESRIVVDERQRRPHT